MGCHVCGANAPTEEVALRQNIGMLVMRQAKSVEGALCKRCIDSHFWPFTITTLVVGWFGVISMIVAPIYIVINVYHFARTRSLPEAYGARSSSKHARASAPSPAAPTVPPAAAQRLAPFEQELRARIGGGEDFADVTFDVAKKAGVTAAQAEAYAESLARA